MSDLISRQDAIDSIMNVPDGNWKSKKYADEIKALPSADRPTGKWVEEDEYGDLLVCTECGFANDYKDNYCQKCGAKMEV